MADALELHEGEVVEKEFKSDYWEKTLCFYSQKRGKYWLTNQRIASSVQPAWLGNVLPPYWKSPMLILNRYSYVMWAGLFRLFPPESR